MKTAHDHLIEVLMGSGMNVHEATRKARIIEKREAKVVEPVPSTDAGPATEGQSEGPKFE